MTAPCWPVLLSSHGGVVRVSPRLEGDSMRGRRRCKRAGARYAAMRHRLSALAVCTCWALSGLRLHAPGRLYVAVYVVSVVC